VVVAAVTPTAADAGRPPTPPPKVTGAGATPPPAWVEVGARSRWLAYSSYCWATACVDFIPPLMRRDLPVVDARRGTELRFRLGFRPKSVRLLLVGATPAKTWALRASASTTWRAARAGVFVLETKGVRGSAGYVLRLRFT
jgi:hypothetical protein